MEHSASESGHLMLITPERVFYAGLLGRPRERCPGAFHVYVATHGGLWLSTAGGQASYGEIAITMPNLRHTITSEHRAAICVAIEPESVCEGVLETWRQRLSGAEGASFARRIRGAYEHLLNRMGGNDVDSAALDQMCFGEALPQRALDPRVARAIARIEKFSGEPVTATACATEVGLSTSRFLHLFKQETAISFRAFRAWKRARHLLNFANQDVNLAHLAQDIGYPDSTHFSHSIRRFYGLMPRAIFSGSRDLAIYRSGRPEVAGSA
jgi:AraC-like DNA-binding protein